MIKKPMLASNDAIVVDAKGKAYEQSDWEPIKKMLPMFISNKLDGIRCEAHPDHGICSRTFKEIPNTYIRTQLEDECPLNLDGEIITYNADGTPKDFHEIEGDVMREGGNSNFKFHIFDNFQDITLPALTRYEDAHKIILETNHPIIEIVPHQLVNTIHEIETFTHNALINGYEGAMLKHLDGLYKEGRSTLKQGWLLKVKHFLHAEGVIIGFEEQMKNTNPKTKDALGHGVRSSHKAGKVPMDTLGKFILMTPFGELKIGGGKGVTKDFRYKVWHNQANYIGKHVTYQYQPCGMKNLPRIATFHGFRKEFD